MDSVSRNRSPSEECGWCPLTFQQCYYYYLQEGGDGVHLLDGAFAFLLSGRLNVWALRKSIEELIRRHDSLRITISQINGSLMQRVIEPFDYPLETMLIPASTTNGISNEEAALHWAKSLANERCRLIDQVLFKASVLRVRETKHVLLFSIHHLISDHVSRTVLLEELWALYRVFISGRVPSFSKLRAQFLYYQAWQERAHRVWMSEHHESWRRYLEGAVGIQWSRVGGVSERGQGADSANVSCASISLSPSVSSAVKDLATRTNTQLSVVMLATYVALVSGLCGQTNFVIATNTTGRDRLEFQYTLGFFAHPIFLRIELTGNESFIGLLDTVRREYYRALFTKDFGGIVRDSQALLSRTLFQWFPSFEELKCRDAGASASPKGSDLNVENLTAEPLASFDVVLTKRLDIMLIFSGAEIISGEAIYRPNVFPSDFIQRLLTSVETLAEGVSNDADAGYSTHLR